MYLPVRNNSTHRRLTYYILYLQRPQPPVNGMETSMYKYHIEGANVLTIMHQRMSHMCLLLLTSITQYMFPDGSIVFPCLKM